MRRTCRWGIRPGSHRCHRYTFRMRYSIQQSSYSLRVPRRRSILILLFAFAFIRPSFCSADPEEAGPLTANEKAILRTATGPYNVVLRKHVVLAWPRGLFPDWDGESRVTNRSDMADWLDDAYRLQMHMTRFDPSVRYQQDSGTYDRLVFIYNGHGDFVSGGSLPIPYVGLRDLKNPKPGTADWFGWLSHELSHDFWHKHPAFERTKNEWGEGMCDYSRYYILLNMGMPRAAKIWKQGLRTADYHDRYRGGAACCSNSTSRTNSTARPDSGPSSGIGTSTRFLASLTGNDSQIDQIKRKWAGFCAADFLMPFSGGFSGLFESRRGHDPDLQNAVRHRIAGKFRAILVFEIPSNPQASFDRAFCKLPGRSSCDPHDAPAHLAHSRSQNQ